MKFRYCVAAITYGDDYIGGVRVESWNMFNALALNNIFDPVSFVPTSLAEGSGVLPEYTNQLINSPSKLSGLSFGDSY